MDKKIRYGIIGTVTALLIFGGYITLTDDELNHAYYCTTNTKIGIFENLSSTNKTGYWYENETKKQSTCTKGEWIPLRTYCEQQGIKDCKTITITGVQEDISTGRYWCTDTCEEIVN